MQLAAGRGLFSILESEGAGGADGNTLCTFLAAGADGLIAEGGDYPVEAAAGKAEDAGADTVPAHPDAPLAEDALVRVIAEQRVALIYGQVSHQPAQPPGF